MYRTSFSLSSSCLGRYPTAGGKSCISRSLKLGSKKKFILACKHHVTGQQKFEPIFSDNFVHADLDYVIRSQRITTRLPGRDEKSEADVTDKSPRMKIAIKYSK